MKIGRAFRTNDRLRGWWATTVRALSFVLVLALVVPGTIHSAEAHRLVVHTVGMSAPADGSTTDHADACPACQAQCGCHQGLSADAVPALPVPPTGRATYDTLITAIGSIAPDRLPRPPRA